MLKSMTMLSFPARRLSGERILLAIVTVLLTISLWYQTGSQPIASSRATTQNNPDTKHKALEAAAAADAQTKFAIISMTTDETSYDYPAFSTKTKYALKHGYDMIWDFKPSRDRSKVWDKVSLIEANVQASLSGAKGYEWVFMIDFDILITNASITLESIVERSLAFAEGAGKARRDIHLILTKDCEPINAGTMFFRASPYILAFLKEWRIGWSSVALNASNGRFNEQEVLSQMLAGNTFGMADHSVIVPQTWFDAYPEELSICRDDRDPASWDPSMFLIHLAGAHWFLKDRLADPVGDLMWKYFRMIVEDNAGGINMAIVDVPTAGDRVVAG